MRMLVPGDAGVFEPAESKAEAAARLYALAGVAPDPLGPGSTEKKSVLIAVAGRLGLDVPVEMPKADLAALMADALEERWGDDCWSRGQTITLTGLNSLLRGATRRSALLSRERSPELPEVLGGMGFEGVFRPARQKSEAVARIAALTGAPPQPVGPGSTERKVTLSRLASDLRLKTDESLSKPRLGEAMARQLGVPWDRSCWSAGSTITLDGLNTLLAGAERHLGLHQAGRLSRWTPASESSAILSALLGVVEPFWDGRTCVTRMRDAEFAHWRQMEWPGFYFEMVGLTSLVDVLGGGPVRHANTRFDYSLGSAWDLKTHTDGSAARGVDRVILNSRDSTDACLESGSGLGYVVLSGAASTSDSFDRWHRQFVGTRERVAGDGRPRRRRKESFSPLRLDTFYFRDDHHLQQAVAGGAVLPYRQGRQQDGAPRGEKWMLDLRRAEDAGFRLDHAAVAG